MENRPTPSTVGNIGSILSDPKCFRILSVLSKRPEFVKRISEALGDDDSHISERLNKLRRIGLVDYSWKRDAGKNVKEYFLIAKKIEISLEGEEPVIVVRGEKKRSFAFPAFFDFSYPTPKYFVGRDKELKILQSNDAVLVTGLPGMGKTTLVSEFVERCNSPIFWHNTREIDSIDYILMKFASFLEKFGINEVSKMMALKVDRRLVSDFIIYGLKKIKAVVVFDDFQFCTDASFRELIKDISRSVPRVKLIVISREYEEIAVNFKVVVLNGFSFEESLQFLRVRGKIHDERTVSVLGGYPIALSLLEGAKEEHVTIEGTLRLLTKEISKKLSDNQKLILKIASAFRESFLNGELSYVAGVNVDKELEILCQRGLIHKNGDRFTVHELVRKATEELEGDIVRIHSKMADFYLSDQQLRSKLEAIYHLAYSNDSRRLIDTLKVSASKLIDSGFSDPFLAVLKQIRGKLIDERARGWILLWISKLEQMNGDYSNSIEQFDEAYRTGASLDEELLVRSMLGKGQSLYLTGKNEESLNLLRKALSINVNSLRSEELEAHILLSMDGPLSQLGFIDEALEALSRSMEIYSRLKDERNYFTCMAYRGWKYFFKGELSAASTDITAAYDGLFSLNSVLSAASCLLQKSIILWKMGKLTTAHRCATKAIEMFSDQSTAISELAEAYSYRALISASKGNLERAEDDIKISKSMIVGQEAEDTRDVIALTEGLIQEKKRKEKRSSGNMECE